MIFSKLFNSKAKWQSKDSNERITAIKDELQLSNDQDVQVLKQLATNDANDLVRRSALIKLNDFSLWYQSYKEEKNNSVKNFALDNVTAILAGDSSALLSEDDKLSFIDKTITTGMAESVLEKSSNSRIVIALIEKINKPQTWPTLFTRKNDLTIQQHILNKISDTNTLEKLLKKAENEDVAALVKEKLAIIALEKHKPVKLLKDVQMVLSKLLALKENKDYELVLEKRTSLNDEWNWLVQDFPCLADAEREQSLNKYESINAQLDKAFAQMKEQYEQELIAKKLENEKLLASQSFIEQHNKYDQLLANAVFENQEIDEVRLKGELETILLDIASSVLNAKEKAKFNSMFTSQLSKLEKIPEIAESVTKATHLISKISQQTPPENIEQLPERYSYFSDWQKEWREIEAKVLGVIPQSIADAKAEIEKQWRDALAPLQKDQKHLFSQTQKKVGELKRLIATGKYNASFGVFKRFKKMFEQLSEHHQQRLQRDFEQLSEKVAELSDWEHYIATPRKQQLLEEVQKLAEQPLDNPSEQANKVKDYRKVWNSLGHADEDVDKAFNESFNEALEKAFAPCRLWYAEQEKFREQHLLVRQQIVADAKTLSAELNQTDVNVKQTEVTLNKLLSGWKEAGEVDRSAYQALNKEFIEATKPIKGIVFNYHNENAALKQKLIEQVKAQHDNDNVFDAVNQVKTLQADWKKIGYAGSKLENKLWNEFRKVNDVVFARRDEEKNKNQNEIDQRVAQVESIIVEFSQKVQTQHTLVEFQTVEQEIKSLHDEQLRIKPVIKQVIVKIEQLLKQVQHKVQALTKNVEQQSWLDTFAVLEKLTSGTLTIDEINSLDEFTALPQSKQKKLLDALSKESGGERLIKTIELEVLAGIDSPASDQSQRMQIQVELMQEKMTSGQTVDLNKAFVDWVSVAHLDKDDEQYLARIKPIFVK